MAQKAKKDRAKSNTESLTTLHLTTALLHILYHAFRLHTTRRLLPYLILSIPSFIAQFILERTGRPTYDPTTKALKSAGEDLNAEGLTEYLFDVVWVTWGVLGLVIVAGDWGWWAWAIVPVFGVWKGWGLLGMARGMMGGNGLKGGGVSEEQMAGQGNRRQRRAA